MKTVTTFSSILALGLIAGGTAQAVDPLTPLEQLGQSIFFDKISSPNSMACAACHGPSVGFTGATPGINKHGAVYRGAVPQRFGNRKPPSSAYATFAPVFQFDDDEGLFIGGNFWNGRATGYRLGNPAADQALGPFLNPVEQNNSSKEAVLEKIAASRYAGLWESVWGDPISADTPEDIETNYGRIGLAIAAYEASNEVNQFSSKFDLFWDNAKAEGMNVTEITMANYKDYQGLGLTLKELHGLALFNDENEDEDEDTDEGEGGKCSLCHVLEPVDVGNGEMRPLFTDFTYDNIGTPKNPENPFYEMDQVHLDDGSPINPMGAAWIDKGLGGFLKSLANPDNQGWRGLPFVTNVGMLTNDELDNLAPDNAGKHKVPTLRNVDKRPGKAFPKAYTHNGYFKTLEAVVNFYNTRDVKPACLDPLTPEADALAQGCWPAPEVLENVNTEELGNLGLTAEEEAALVAFMKTLSDGYFER